jgi:uncharacterized membrane protein
MSNQPPYGYPGGPQGGYQGGGYPPPGAPTGKTKVLNLDYGVAGVLAYLPICCINLIFSIIWLATEPKENRVLRFHSFQSLLLIAVIFVVNIVFYILGTAAAVAPGPGGAAAAAGFGIVSLLQLVVGLGFLVICIIGCIKAYQGQIWKLPIIGDIAEKNS